MPVNKRYKIRENSGFCEVYLAQINVSLKLDQVYLITSLSFLLTVSFSLPTVISTLGAF